MFDEFDETCRQIEVLVSGIKAMTAEHSVNSCKWSIDDSFAGNGCLYFSRRITQGAVGVKCNLCPLVLFSVCLQIQRVEFHVFILIRLFQTVYFFYIHQIETE